MQNLTEEQQRLFGEMIKQDLKELQDAGFEFYWDNLTPEDLMEMDKSEPCPEV